MRHCRHSCSPLVSLLPSYMYIYLSFFPFFDTVHGHPESRVRHWNAYMLFYEAVGGAEKSHLDVVNGKAGGIG